MGRRLPTNGWLTTLTGYRVQGGQGGRPRTGKESVLRTQRRYATLIRLISPGGSDPEPVLDRHIVDTTAHEFQQQVADRFQTRPASPSPTQSPAFSLKISARRDYRERAKGMLDQIAEQARIALAEQGFDTPVFFIVPNSWDAIVTFGTITDPPDDQWRKVGKIVSAIVGRTVGLDRPRCRPVTCAATTDSAADHQPAQSSDQPTGALASQSMPMQQLEGNCQ